MLGDPLDGKVCVQISDRENVTVTKITFVSHIYSCNHLIYFTLLLSDPVSMTWKYLYKWNRL